LENEKKALGKSAAAWFFCGGTEDKAKKSVIRNLRAISE